LVYNYHFAKVFSFQPELLFTQGGYYTVETIAETNSVKNEEFKYDFIQVPLLLKAGVGTRKYRVNINIGPYLGFNMGGNVNSKTGNIENIKSFKLSGSKAFEFGFMGGVGDAYRLGTGCIFYVRE